MSRNPNLNPTGRPTRPAILVAIVIQATLAQAVWAAEEKEDIQGSPSVVLTIRNAAGDFVQPGEMGELYLLDQDWNPIPKPVWDRALGVVRFRPNIEATAVIVSYRLAIPGFGDFVLYADNGGTGYELERKKPLELNLLRELARSRLLAVEQAASPYLAEQQNVFSEATLVGLGQARTTWEQAQTVEGYRLQEKYVEVIRDAGLASESVALEIAHYKISQYQEPRRGFRFGVGALHHGLDTPERNACVERIATDVTVSFAGWSGSDPVELAGFSPVDAVLSWAFIAGLRAKGQPLLWMSPENLLPEDFGTPSVGEMQLFATHRIRNIVSAYRTSIRTWHAIDEAHDIANAFGYTQDELIGITKSCAEAVRTADPQALCLINCSHLRGEYRGRDEAQNSPAMTPYQYLERCKQAKVPFDAAGLSMPYADMDLFETKRLLDRFAQLGIPIHITRLEVPNEGETLAWHGVWNEALQAEYLEGLYTIAYAHPAVWEVVYWEPIEPTFVLNTGIVNEDFTPKAAYIRLAERIEEWQGAKSTPVQKASESAEPSG